jgi:hypothetical protein
MGLGEPQPAGLYVTYWVAAILLGSLIILLDYNQAIVFASRMQVLSRLSEVAGQETGSDLVMVELQNTLESTFGLRLKAFVDNKGDTCLPDVMPDFTENNQSALGMVNRVLSVMSDTESEMNLPLLASLSEIEDIAGESAGDILDEVMVMLPGRSARFWVHSVESTGLAPISSYRTMLPFKDPSRYQLTARLLAFGDFRPGTTSLERTSSLPQGDLKRGERLFCASRTCLTEAIKLRARWQVLLLDFHF